MTKDEREIVELARGYNAPPETPREAMWAAIREEIAREGRRAGDGSPEDAAPDVIPLRRPGRKPLAFQGLPPWMGLAAAAGLVLALGVGIGRMTAPGTPGGSGLDPVAGPAVASGGPGADAAPAFRAQALDHLGRSESLLTMVRSDARAGRYDAEVGRWARGLLVETRLLMDSPAGEDPAVADLLSDLELILAQVAVLAPDQGERAMDPGRARSELELIAQGLDERDVLSRIQAVTPAGAGLLGS